MKLAVPNVIAMFGSTLVAVAETSYIGRLGIEPLAAIALAFPFVVLTQMMSAGAMGGGVSSAISRAIGAGDRDRAATLALHAVMIGLLGGLFFTVTMLLFGPQFFMVLGGRGGVLEQATQYSQVLFSGAVSIWLVNTLASVLRGTGEMRLPSATLLGVAIVQVVAGGGLGLGVAGLPQWGMRGVAAGQLIAFSLGAMFLAWILVSGRSRLTLDFRAFAFQRAMFVDILKVGAISCLAPLQSILTILIFTRILAGFGTATLAGYGIGSRFEILMTPVALAFGLASVPMVGMAVGAGLVARARKVAWTAGAATGLAIGLIGLIVAVEPGLWVAMFTSDPGVTAAASSYFAWAGPAFGFFGMGTCLYLASQGAAKVGGPVLAGTGRLLLVALGGWFLVSIEAPAWTLFALVGAGMVLFGLGVATAVRLTRWGEWIFRAVVDWHQRDFLLCRPDVTEMPMSCRFGFIVALLAALLGAGAAQAQSGGDVAGTWLTQAGDARVRVSHCGAGLCGVIVGLRDPIDPATGKPQVDDKNPNPALKRRPMIGLPLFSGMHPSGPNRWSGQIYNADDGSTYVSHVSLAGPDTLKVEGCMGALCGGESWTRVGR